MALHNGFLRIGQTVADATRKVDPLPDLAYLDRFQDRSR